MHAAVIDDSIATRTILTNMLRECGLSVHEAAGHDSALVLLRSRPEIRIILIDFWNAKYQKMMFYVVIALWVVTMLAFVPRHLINVFSE